MHSIKLFLIGILLSLACSLQAQVLIHSHNDYDHAHPFWGAFREQADFIEADVFPVHGKLMVAHARCQITPGHTLDKMYLEPIIRLFQKNHNKTVSGDPDYTFYLMIDIKEKWDSVLPLLEKKLQAHPACFNRSINPMAVQIFISGDRPPDSSFHSYPVIIMFDGLPGKKYKPTDLKKVVEISTNFHLYSHWNREGKIPLKDAQALKQVINDAHRLGKRVRFWGAPDTPDCWKTLIGLGADIINTDHVKACRDFLDKHQF